MRKASLEMIRAALGDLMLRDASLAREVNIACDELEGLRAATISTAEATPCEHHESIRNEWRIATGGYVGWCGCCGAVSSRGEWTAPSGPNRRNDAIPDIAEDVKALVRALWWEPLDGDAKHYVLRLFHALDMHDNDSEAWRTQGQRRRPDATPDAVDTAIRTLEYEAGLREQANHDAAQALLRMLALYPGYKVLTRGPVGCVHDALREIAPEFQRRLADGADPHDLLDPDAEDADYVECGAPAIGGPCTRAKGHLSERHWHIGEPVVPGSVEEATRELEEQGVDVPAFVARVTMRSDKATPDACPHGFGVTDSRDCHDCRRSPETAKPCAATKLVDGLEYVCRAGVAHAGCATGMHAWQLVDPKDWRALYRACVAQLSTLAEIVGNTNGDPEVTIGIVRNLAAMGRESPPRCTCGAPRGADHGIACPALRSDTPDEPAEPNAGPSPWEAHQFAGDSNLYLVERLAPPGTKATPSGGTTIISDVLCEVHPTDARWGEPARTAEENATRIAKALNAWDDAGDSCGPPLAPDHPKAKRGGK